MWHGDNILGRLLAAATLALALGMAPPALADTKTNIVGAGDGTPFSWTCPGGDALIGWGWNALYNMTGIAPVCQALVNGKPSGAKPGAPTVGFGHACTGSPVCKTIIGGGPVVCPNGGFMIGVEVSLNAQSHVHHLRAICKADGHPREIIKASTTVPDPAAVAVSSSEISCISIVGSGSYAVGVLGAFGKTVGTGITAFGLICSSPDQSADTPPADTGDSADTADTGSDTADVGDTGDSDLQEQIDVGIGPDGVSFGPKGKARVLREPSTLYADRGDTEIAYFDAGDTVIVSACESKGRGWCKVIRPQPGLIWGGDLK